MEKERKRRKRRRKWRKRRWKLSRVEGNRGTVEKEERVAQAMRSLAAVGAG